MKRFLVGLMLGGAMLASLGVAQARRGSSLSRRTEHVSGYVNKNGKYVKPYHRAPAGMSDAPTSSPSSRSHHSSPAGYSRNYSGGSAGGADSGNSIKAGDWSNDGDTSPEAILGRQEHAGQDLGSFDLKTVDGRMAALRAGFSSDEIDEAIAHPAAAPTTQAAAMQTATTSSNGLAPEQPARQTAAEQRPETAKSKPADRNVWYGVVTHVDSDGTLYINHEGQVVPVLLYGVICPEPDRSDHDFARNQLNGMALHETVRVEVKSTNQDGSVSAWVSLKNVLLNSIVLEMGSGWWDREGAPDEKQLGQSEVTARQGKKGIWGLLR